MPSDKLHAEMIGTWELLGRIDRAADGSLRDEPGLGSDPLALLTYTRDRFAAQFMRRAGRGGQAGAVRPGANNTASVDGYDAYFGTYRLDGGGKVMHRLEAALTAENVGMEVMRMLSVENGQLVIRLPTTTAAGEPVERCLTWRRVT
jgi:hypothetical protein